MDDNEKMAEVGGREAGYLFEFRSDGVFLTVYPNEEEGILFELSDMRQILREYGVIDYDMDLLARIVRKADGMTYQLAEHFEASVVPASMPELELEPFTDDMPADELQEMKFTLDVSKDRMKVTVRIDRQPRMRPPTVDSIMEALASRRIVYGIDQQAIEKGVERGTEFVAARGTPPEAGKDAKIIRHFSMAEKNKPALGAHGRVDFKNMNLFVLAKKGQVLVTREPHTQGTPGKTVFGDEVKPKPGKPRPVPVGKNVELRDDNTLVAAIDGQIIDTGSKVSIDPRLVIKGDVGVQTGNIDFDGAVEIGGNVQPGFMVKATGDISIKGVVNGAMVKGYNVTIESGIQGMNRGIVMAEETVRAQFVENGKVEAGGDILIEDVALHSDLRAGRLLAVEGKRGLVTGGYLAAGEEVRAKTIGNQALVATRIVVGVNPMLQRRYQQACKEYAEAKKKLAQLTKALNTLGKIDISRLPPHRAAQITEMTRSQFPLAGKVERDEKLIRDLEEQIAHMQVGKIRVSDKIYPGARIIINSVIKNVQDELQHCTLSVIDDEVRTSPYE